MNVPEYFRQFNVIAIDPGLSQCGIAVFSMVEDQLASIHPFTIVNSQIRYESDLPIEYHTERNQRINLLCQTFRQVLQQYNPILIVCESPFFNPTRPTAFGSLTETLAVLRYETFLYNSIIPFITFSPQEVKQTFKQSGKIGKLVMKDALQARTDIVTKLITPVELLDEHSIDAIAVGCTWLDRRADGRM